MAYQESVTMSITGTVLCVFCGKRTSVKRYSMKKYCSPKCRLKANRAKNKKPPMLIALEVLEGNAYCHQCGRKFYRKTSRGLYCGVTCRVAAYRKEKAE